MIPQGRRKVWKSGGLVVMVGDNVPILVEIGWIGLPKTGGAKAYFYLSQISILNYVNGTEKVTNFNEK